MIVYAIRNKHTGLFIPAGKKGNAHTFEEATSKDKPRIHHTSSGCKNALNMWLQGKWQFYSYYNDECELDAKKVNTRKKEDMEIVEFLLQELS